ncbi:MAG: aldose 1-epimerase [Solirubrobacteraceae bacterium]
MASTDGFASATIVAASGTTKAQFVPDANMLCCSLSHDGVELLDGGQGVRAYAERGKTMGIPLLYPWANRLSQAGYRAGGKQVALPAPEGRYALDPNGLPMHGALPGLLHWQLQDTGEADRLRARLEWRDPELLELFPFSHEVALDVHVAEGELQLITTVRATGADTVPVSFGYHPYLIPPGTEPREAWRVSLGASQQLVLDDLMIPTGTTEPLAERTFALGRRSLDDGLSGLGTPPEFSVAAGAQRVHVTLHAGYRFAQVYAPEGHDFICFEPMTAPTNALVTGDDLLLVRPGDEHRGAFTIAVADN